MLKRVSGKHSENVPLDSKVHITKGGETMESVNSDRASHVFTKVWSITIVMLRIVDLIKGKQTDLLELIFLLTCTHFWT